MYVRFFVLEAFGFGFRFFFLLTIQRHKLDRINVHRVDSTMLSEHSHTRFYVKTEFRDY